MNSQKTLEKYVNDTFNTKVCKVNYTSSLTAEVELLDGVIKLLALNNIITVYIEDKVFQTLELTDFGFKIIV